MFIDNIPPAFHTNNIPVVLSANDGFIPYLSVALGSLITHASDGRNYDILILENHISRRKKDVISGMADGKLNISIRFIDCSVLAEAFKNRFKLTAHFTIETYFRFFISEICRCYEKLIYLDGDLLILRDIADMYDTDMDHYLLAAVKDVEVARALGHERMTGAVFWENYNTRVLGLANAEDYFQAGVLLINIKEMLASDIQSKLLETAHKITPVYADQCILNAVCAGRVKYMDMRWNVLWHLPIYHENINSSLPEQIHLIYQESRRAPYIIHYAGEKKPWYYPQYELASLWWEYAKRTPFYPWIAMEVKKYRIGSNFIKVLKRWLRPFKFILKPIYDRLCKRYAIRERR